MSELTRTDTDRWKALAVGMSAAAAVLSAALITPADVPDQTSSVALPQVQAELIQGLIDIEPQHNQVLLLERDPGFRCSTFIGGRAGNENSIRGS